MKICKYIAPLLVLLAACQREGSPVTPETPVLQLVEHTLYASTPGEDEPATRTVVSALNDKKILWSAHERISILSGGVNYLFQGENDAPAATASFTGTGPVDLASYIALYPYNLSATYSEGYVSTTLPAYQLGKAGSFGDGYLITADDATGNSLSFKHLCSGLRFMVNTDNIKAVTIRGNNGEKIAGDFRFRFASEDTPVVEAGTEEYVTLRPSSGSTFEAGKYYYIIVLPTVFSKGFTLMADNGSQVGEFRFNSSVTFSAGLFKNITGNLNERMTWTTPSSQVYYGYENSFCLRPGKTIRFDVNPRKIYGTWQRSGLLASAPVPDEAAVLWGDGSISSASVSVYDGSLTVTASTTPGSALVAIKKGSTILWSYLIWVTESAPAETTLPSGAKALPALGGNCYFQWGRKDPLLSSTERVENPESGCLAYSILHPTAYIKFNSSNYDRTDDIDWTLWGEGVAKTVWDPCPTGYRVPAKEDYSAITASFLTGNFEALGYITNDGYHLSDYFYWTRSTGIQGDVRKLSWSLSWYSGTSESDIILTDYRYPAYPVRCVKE